MQAMLLTCAPLCVAQFLATTRYDVIEFFKIPPGTTPIMYLPLSAHISAEDPTSQLDVMLKTSMLLHHARPSWSGMMQMLHHGEYPGECSVMFLPNE